ncbi:PilZ domain-containing protein [Phreatobacter aquaticus]|nr:PilZ domain-containing protein [Phreatobacter aquaticus]
MEERRAALRSRTFWKGTVLFPGGLRSTECTVRNFSETGARLDCGGVSDIPDHFQLKIPQKGSALFRCKVAWRRVGEIGVHFETDDVAISENSLVRKIEALEGQNRALLRRLRNDDSGY